MDPEALDDTMKQTLRCALALATITFSALAAVSDAATPAATELPGSADRQVGTEVARCYSCPAWSQILWQLAGAGGGHESHRANEAS
jgi:hypothetical protein